VAVYSGTNIIAQMHLEASQSQRRSSSSTSRQNQ